MVEGVLIAESLRPGSKLTRIELAVTSVDRVEITEPAAGQPPVWTLISFRSSTDPKHLASVVSAALSAPGWYADFHDEERKWVIFPDGVVFAFSRGDDTTHQAAIQHGLSLGIPAEQLDWQT